MMVGLALTGIAIVCFGLHEYDTAYIALGVALLILGLVLIVL